MKKLSLIIFLIILLTLVLTSFSFAQRPLEVDYPKFGDVETTSYLPDYVKYIYYAAIGISGLIALAMLTWAGFDYLTSTGNPEKMKDAKDKIISVILGLVILFGSYLIVNTINPELTILKLTPLESSVPQLLNSGVYNCSLDLDSNFGAFQNAWDLTREFYDEKTTDQKRKELKEKINDYIDIINDYCYIIGTNSKYSGIGVNNYIFIVPGTGKDSYQWDGALIFTEENFLGNIHTIMPPPDLISAKKVSPFGFKAPKEFNSIMTFHLNPGSSDWKVSLYQHENKNRDYDENPIVLEGAAPWETNTYRYSYPLYGFQIRSMEIEGNLITILSNKQEGKNAVFTEGYYPNLLKNENLRKQICKQGSDWRECETDILGIDTINLILGEIYY